VQGSRGSGYARDSLWLEQSSADAARLDREHARAARATSPASSNVIASASARSTSGAAASSYLRVSEKEMSANDRALATKLAEAERHEAQRQRAEDREERAKSALLKSGKTSSSRARNRIP